MTGRALEEEVNKVFVNRARGEGQRAFKASISGYEKEVFELAVKEGLSVYDGFYLYHAYEVKFIPETYDEKLGMKAKEYVETLKTKKLA